MIYTCFSMNLLSFFARFLIKTSLTKINCFVVNFFQSLKSKIFNLLGKTHKMINDFKRF